MANTKLRPTDTRIVPMFELWLARFWDCASNARPRVRRRLRPTHESRQHAEGVQQRSADVARYPGELQRAFADTREGPIGVVEEPLRESDALFLVPARSVLEIGLDEWPNDEP